MINKQVRRVSLLLSLTSLTVFLSPAAFAGSLAPVGGSWAFPGSGGEAEAYGISIYEKIVELAGGVENAKVGVISTASSNPERSANLYFEDFDALYG